MIDQFSSATPPLATLGEVAVIHGQSDEWASGEPETEFRAADHIIGRLTGDAKAKAADLLGRATGRIEQRPLAAIFIAFSLGLIGSRLFRR
jgi:hypothetical protein